MTLFDHRANKPRPQSDAFLSFRPLRRTQDTLQEKSFLDPSHSLGMTGFGPSLAYLRHSSAMWMSSPLHTRPLFFFFLHDFPTSRPKRDLLLFVARHTAVTLTRNAPLFRAQGPGISVSRVEPSGVFFSRFSTSSSRSLGRCLLLGQRS